jgi:tetratricopeptide (TPR) repeat protein
MLLARTELAVILRDMKQLEEAILVQETVVDQRKEFDGIEAATTRDAISCLAVMYYAKKDYEEARRLEELVLDHANFGTDAASLAQRATWMRNLAITYYRLEMYEEAMKLETKVLAARRSLFGDHHLETAGAMDSLAVTLQRRNILDEAEQLFTEALSVRIQKLGERHEKTRKTRNNLSKTRKLAGKL